MQMMDWTRPLALLMAGAMGASAQAPKFDVVSVKPCPAGGKDKLDSSPGRLRVECTTAEGLIRNAFIQYASGKPWAIDPKTGMRVFPVMQSQLKQTFKGTPGWIRSERFTIDAKAASPAGLEMMRGPMTQALLKDRFRLSLHKEMREVPVLNLVVDKGGAKVTPMKEGSCIVWDPAKPPPMFRAKGQPPPIMCGSLGRSDRGGIDARGMTMALLCEYLSLHMNQDFIDKTGLTETYDLHLELSFDELLATRRSTAGTDDPSAPPLAADPGGSLASALRKQGLRLEPGKMQVEFLIIDRVERPSGN